jgi:hypothetical protein
MFDDRRLKTLIGWHMHSLGYRDRCSVSRTKFRVSGAAPG